MYRTKFPLVTEGRMHSITIWLFLSRSRSYLSSQLSVKHPALLRTHPSRLTAIP